MAFDLWTYQFCLACDKQVQSDAAAYCSEPCQMIDSERATLPPNSQVSSPGFPPSPTKFYVSRAYDLSTARSCETTAQKRPWIHSMVPGTEQPWLHAEYVLHPRGRSPVKQGEDGTASIRYLIRAGDSAAEAVLLARIAAMSCVQPIYCIMSMYISNGGPEADWEVYATTENVTHSKLARRATYNHNTYLTTPLFSATFAATRR
ncbi:uncharacterized protein BKA55DRAFT_540838 [Fusarium redolens]|uniref:Uncharacterized protein n=1 Tax=Fusarium redolens TaxID=48865 RepID=A0A9P9K3C1_FUSRE|nr:uncharacterized protein BKA55DRAFT_540838 [Fusarium redolens]KAH7247587.1 hypothetical protein BKA55DRAFT_540838 [Fusarium redolens]